MHPLLKLGLVGLDLGKGCLNPIQAHFFIRFRRAVKILSDPKLLDDLAVVFDLGESQRS